MKRPYLLLACLSPVACLMAASGQKGGKNKQKVNDRQLLNVVFIYADDLGYGDLSCQGAAKDIQTPHIDKLLNEVGSKYLLVNLISKRVKEMEETNNYQMKEKEYKSKKNIGRALEEVYNHKIHLR